MSRFAPASAFDPEQHALKLVLSGALLFGVSMWAGGWWMLLAPVSVLLVLFACYSRQDGLLIAGPFAAFELRRAGRRRWPPQLMRFGLGVSVGLITVLCVRSHVPEAFSFTDKLVTDSRLAEASQVLLRAFAILVTLAAVVLAFMLIPGVIAEERAGKRWDVLLTTDLRGREIVLGKLLGRLPRVLEPVLIALPVAAVLPLLGGGPAGVVWQFTVALIAVLLALTGLMASQSLLQATGTIAGSGAFGAVSLYWAVFFFSTQFVQPSMAWRFPESVGVSTPVVLADVFEIFGIANPVSVWYFADQRRPLGMPRESVYPEVARVLVGGGLAAFVLLVGQTARRLRSAPEPALPNKPKPESRQARRIAKIKGVWIAARPPVTDEPLAWWEQWRVPNSIMPSAPPSRTERGLMSLGLSATAARFVRQAVVAAVLFALAYPADIFGATYLTEFPYGLWLTGEEWPLVKRVRIITAIGLGGGALVVMIAALNRGVNTLTRERGSDTFQALWLTPLSGRDIIEQKFHGCAEAEASVTRTIVAIALGATLAGIAHPLTPLGLAVMLPVYRRAAAAVGLAFGARSTSTTWVGWMIVLVGGGSMLAATLLTSLTLGQASEQAALAGAMVIIPAAASSVCAAAVTTFYTPIDTLTQAGFIAATLISMAVWTLIGRAALAIAIHRFERERP